MVQYLSLATRGMEVVHLNAIQQMSVIPAEAFLQFLA